MRMHSLLQSTSATVTTRGEGTLSLIRLDPRPNRRKPSERIMAVSTAAESVFSPEQQEWIQQLIASHVTPVQPTSTETAAKQFVLRARSSVCNELSGLAFPMDCVGVFIVVGGFNA